MFLTFEKNPGCFERTLLNKQNNEGAK